MAPTVRRNWPLATQASHSEIYLDQKHDLTWPPIKAQRITTNQLVFFHLLQLFPPFPTADAQWIIQNPRQSRWPRADEFLRRTSQCAERRDPSSASCFAFASRLFKTSESSSKGGGIETMSTHTEVFPREFVLVWKAFNNIIRLSTDPSICLNLVIDIYIYIYILQSREWSMILINQSTVLSSI